MLAHQGKYVLGVFVAFPRFPFLNHLYRLRLNQYIPRLTL